MTLEEILADIKSDRVKKVIMDCDAYNDIDDQYAIAFALASDKIDVLSINATLFNNYRCNGYEDGMRRSHAEIVKILKLLDREDVPVYEGCIRPLNEDDGDDGWTDSPAVQNIINTVKNSDEMIYIIATGAATNVACALRADKSIWDNLCILWLGSNTFDNIGCSEFNVGQDPIACRYMTNCGVNMMLVPCVGPNETGAQVLIIDQDNIKNIKGDNDVARFFREDLPELSYPGESVWFHHLWDVAVPAILNRPEVFDLSIVMTGRMRGDDIWVMEPNRHNILYMRKIQKEVAMGDYFDMMNKLVKEKNV